MRNFEKKLEYVWIILVILTIFAYLLAYLNIITSALVAVLLITTFIKGALVSDVFMGLRNVSMKYRLIPLIWLGLIILFIGTAYYLPIEG